MASSSGGPFPAMREGTLKAGYAVEVFHVAQTGDGSIRRTHLCVGCWPVDIGA